MSIAAPHTVPNPTRLAQRHSVGNAAVAEPYVRLLIAAGLFVKSLANVARVDLGIKTDHIVTFGVSPELNGYTPAQSIACSAELPDAGRDESPAARKRHWPA